MQIALVVMLYLSLAIYLYFFIRKTSEVAYRLHSNKKENMQEEISFKLFSYYKYISYSSISILLFASIFIAPHIRLKIWMMMFNIIWIASILFITLNIKLIDHLINVMYVRSALKTVEKELLIGGVIKEKHRLYFSYRLTRDKFYI